MRALSIRQPYAELILRGIKRIEYRSRATQLVGERFWIYASKGKSQLKIANPPTRVVGDNIEPPGKALPPWMIELANGLQMFPHELPTGVIVGSAVIEKCVRCESAAIDDPMSVFYEWHLAHVERARQVRKPAGHPQPVWFIPFPGIGASSKRS